MKHLLGIDYGRKHVGLAIAITPLSEPVETVSIEQCFEKIDELIDQHQIERVVVGVSEGKMAEESREFGEKIKDAFEIDLVFYDETLSSLETRQKLSQAGKKKSQRESKIDHVVAAAILQDYIDSTN